MTDTIVKNHGF